MENIPRNFLRPDEATGGMSQVNSGEFRQDQGHSTFTIPTKAPTKTVDFISEPKEVPKAHRQRGHIRKMPIDDSMKECGCRKNKHLPHCRVREYEHQPAELFVDDLNNAEVYTPIQPREFSTARPMIQRVDQPVESLDIFDGVENDDDEVISPTPTLPRRRIIQRPQLASPAVHPYQDRHVPRNVAVNLESRDLFSDSDEVIPDSRIHDFPRRRRPHGHPQYYTDTDPQLLIELANKTINESAMAFRELSEQIEHRLNDISQMMINSTAYFSLPLFNNRIHHHRDAAIQYDAVPPVPIPWQINEQRTIRKDAMTGCNQPIIEQKSSAIQIPDNLARDKRITREITIMKNVHKEVPSRDQYEQTTAHQETSVNSIRDDNSIFSSGNFHSSRSVNERRMMMTSQIQRTDDSNLFHDGIQHNIIGDDRTYLVNNFSDRNVKNIDPRRMERRQITFDEKCDLARCNVCQKLQLPTSTPASMSRKIAMSTSIVESTHKEKAGTPVHQATQPQIIISPPSASQPVSLERDTTYNVPIPMHDQLRNTNTADTAMPGVQVDRGSQRQDASSAATHSYNLRPRVQRTQNLGDHMKYQTASQKRGVTKK